MSTATQLTIRWLIRRYLPDVLALEAASFDREHAWSELDFLTALRRRDTLGMVALHQEQIVGFFIQQAHPCHLRILNFAVDPWFRRCGVGAAMVDRIKEKLAWRRRRVATAIVREANVDAQLFFKAQGFRWQKTLRGYFHSDEDAYRLVFRLNPERNES